MRDKKFEVFKAGGDKKVMAGINEVLAMPTVELFGLIPIDVTSITMATCKTATLTRIV